MAGGSRYFRLERPPFISGHCPTGRVPVLLRWSMAFFPHCYVSAATEMRIFPAGTW